MKIVNSIMPMSAIEALAANGQKLRVAVTKTSAQGKAAQSATPNLMSFSTDENSIWFNGKKYGVHLFKDSIYTLSTSSSHQDIVNALNGLDNSNIKSFVDTGVIGVFRLNESPDHYQGIVMLGYKEEEPIHMQLYITDNHYNTKYISINISTPTKYVVEAVEDSSLLKKADVANSLTLTSTTAPLSAAMGKKLQDEKLAKRDIVDNLSTSDSKKPLSAKQGLALATMITELEDNKETYQLLKTLESGTLSTQSEIDAILGPYSSFNAALNAGKVIHGVYKDNTNRMNTVAFSAFNDTANSRVRMFAILNNSTLLHILATYSKTNWTSTTTSEEPFNAGITIE